MKQLISDEEMRELEKLFHAERVRTSDEEYLVIYPGNYWDWQRAIEKLATERALRVAAEVCEYRCPVSDGQAYQWEKQINKLGAAEILKLMEES